MTYPTVDAARSKATVSLDAQTAAAPVAAQVPATSTLLPLPSPLPSVDVGDALSKMMAMSANLNDAQSKSSIADANHMSALRKAATDEMLKKLNDAAEEAKKAKESSGGLMGFISKHLGGAGLIGLCTGNFYLVAADFLAHATKLEDNKVDLTDGIGIAATLAGPAGTAVYMGEQALKKYGPDDLSQAMQAGPSISDDKVAIVNQMLLTAYEAEFALAATVMSGGTAAPAVVAMVGIGISTTTQLASQSGLLKAVFKSDAGYVEMGGALTGAALTLGVGAYNGVTSVMNGAANFRDLEGAAKLASTAKTMTEGAYDIGEGVNNWVAAGHEHDADILRIDAKKQQQMAEFLERTMSTLIDDMKAKEKSHERTTQVLSNAIQSNDQTQLIASNLKV